MKSEKDLKQFYTDCKIVWGVAINKLPDLRTERNELLEDIIWVFLIQTHEVYRKVKSKAMRFQPKEKPKKRGRG